MKLNYKRVENGWIVTRTINEEERHSHLSTEGGCKTLIRLINQKRLPKSPYLKEAARRLLTEREYEKLSDKVKQRYYNVGKKVKRVM